MKPVIQLVEQDDQNRPKLRVNEHGLSVLKKVVLEAEASLSYQRQQGNEANLPSRHVSGKIDRFFFELVVIRPEIDPADPAQHEKVEPKDNFNPYDREKDEEDSALDKKAEAEERDAKRDDRG